MSFDKIGLAPDRLLQMRKGFLGALGKNERITEIAAKNGIVLVESNGLLKIVDGNPVAPGLASEQPHQIKRLGVPGIEAQRVLIIFLGFAQTAAAMVVDTPARQIQALGIDTHLHLEKQRDPAKSL